MNIESAKEQVKTAFPNCEIIESYSGVIGGEDLYAIVISDKKLNRTIEVYSDGDMNEINGPMASILIHSLRKE